MPLASADCARKSLLQRKITIDSYVREDDLVDVEGHLTDVSSWSSTRFDESLRPAGEPIHSMWLRLTVDRTATIVAAQAVTDSGPYGSACGEITPDYGQLVGVQVKSGYRDTIRRLFGRTAGCTHLNELAGAMGTALLQAVATARVPNQETASGTEKPSIIDGCHALKSTGPQVAKFYPRWYRQLA